MLILFVLFSMASATHFRGGTISWTRTSSSSRTVNFTVVMHFFIGGVFPSAAHIRLCYGNGACNSPNSSASFLNGTWDATGQIRTIQYRQTYTYGSSSSFVAFIDSNARQNAIINGPGASYRIEAGVNLMNSLCLGNPLAVIPGVQYFPIATNAFFQISPSSAAAQELSYGWFSGSKLVVNPPKSPSNVAAALQAVAPSFNGVLVKWNSSSCTAGSLYAVSVLANIVGVPSCYAVWDITLQLESIEIPTCLSGAGSQTIFTTQT